MERHGHDNSSKFTSGCINSQVIHNFFSPLKHFNIMNLIDERAIHILSNHFLQKIEFMINERKRNKYARVYLKATVKQ